MKNKLFKKSNTELNETEQTILEYASSIPEQFNQLELSKSLTNPTYDWLFNISNRKDGKSFNWTILSVELGIKNQFRAIWVARHYTVKNALITQTYKFIEQAYNDKIFKYNPKDFTHINSDFYTTMYYKGEPILLFTDLNVASDLKFSSAVLREYSYIIYDEFLALKGDYTKDEVEKLKTIYQTMNRPPYHKDLGGKIKIVCLGNPVNFSSPLLAYHNMFDMIEETPRNSFTYREKPRKIIYEYNWNENVVREEDTSAFGEDDPMITAQFVKNHTLIADKQLKRIALNSFTIALEECYIKVWYKDQNTFYYEATFYEPDVDYAFTLKDVHKNTTIITNKFYKVENMDKFQRKVKDLRFANNYTRDVIDDSNLMKQLSIKKMIKYHMKTKQVDLTTEQRFLKAEALTKLNNLYNMFEDEINQAKAEKVEVNS
ncbi:hypothetical protein [Lactococcus petauri]|uniref:hypothetical protein n=1 Tax=Lactococcus petauri TaxID=1940789 RepID=UPI0021182937|nr:hypothetical protein [Lactococcus petauri]MCQ8276820.1 hypothetical protein [Lactococcus petauri]MCR6590491.1 hypothetical protein [Lactococcus petauri]